MFSFKKSATVAFLTIIFSLIYHCNYAQGFLRASGRYIVNGSGEKVILKGMGLGGYMLQEGYMMKVPFSGQQYVLKEKIKDLVGEEQMNMFYSSWLKNHTTKRDIDSLKSWGFNSVRLPMHYNLFTYPIEKELKAGSNTWLEQGFTYVDSLLSWCKQNKIYLILDMHAAPGGQGHDVAISDRDTSKLSLWESSKNQEKLIQLWKKLADRYKDEPFIGGYDLLNEPNWGFQDKNDKSGATEKINEPLKQLLKNITSAIRSVDKKHLIIIEGNNWGNNYNGILPAWDDNMAISFHKYWNYNKQENLKAYLSLRDQYNIPLWMGESGENSNIWFNDAISLAQKNEIGWCLWPLKKIGFNNPLEIKLSIRYQNLLNYWAGNGTRPEKEDAFNALMELADNAKIENCIFHKDVIDAIFRQTYTDSTLPFKLNKIKAGSILNAVDYDLGKQGYAYYDLTPANYHISTGKKRTLWNNGRVYRNDGVDIIQMDKIAGDADYYVTDFEKDEWLTYTLNAIDSGIYNLKVTVRASNLTAMAEVSVNGLTPKYVEIPSNSNWISIPVTGIVLKKGKNILKIKSLQGQFDFKNIVFEIK